MPTKVINEPSGTTVAHFRVPEPTAQHLNAQAALLSISKVPPYWSSELELQGFLRRTYLHDVRIWSSSSELATEAKRGAVVQRRGGVAWQTG